MIQRLSDFAYRKTNTVSIAVVFTLFLLINLLLFPYFMNQIGYDKRILDLSFGYTPNEAYAALVSYGETGRAAYINMLVYADMIYPLVYSAFLVMGISISLKKIVSQGNNSILRINILPVFAGIFDVSENTWILIMLKNYPEKVDYAARLASYSGILKFSFISICLGIIIASLIINIIQKARKKKSHT